MILIHGSNIKHKSENSEGSVFRSQAGADSVVDDPGGAPTIKGHCECNGKVKIQDTRNSLAGIVTRGSYPTQARGQGQRQPHQLEDTHSARSTHPPEIIRVFYLLL